MRVVLLLSSISVMGVSGFWNRVFATSSAEDRDPFMVLLSMNCLMFSRRFKVFWLLGVWGVWVISSRIFRMV